MPLNKSYYSNRSSSYSKKTLRFCRTSNT